VVLGAWQFLREPLIAEMAAKAGYDYVCVDLQHGLHTFDSALASLAHMAGGPAVPLVRAPLHQGWEIGRLLDAGALGVIVPMVNTPSDAESAVRACTYPPRGERSFGPLGAVTRFGPDYVRQSDAVTAVLPMIETTAALAAVDEIAAVPGVTGLYVGPADLASSMGFAPALDTAEQSFDDALRLIAETCRRRGIVPGIHASAALAGKRYEQGFRLITVSSDHQPIAGAFGADLSLARSGTGLPEEPRRALGGYTAVP
jgi:4-hydroxy-2-oxoheptanedioate aldolase